MKKIFMLLSVFAFINTASSAAVNKFKSQHSTAVMMLVNDYSRKNIDDLNAAVNRADIVNVINMTINRRK